MKESFNSFKKQIQQEFDKMKESVGVFSIPNAWQTWEPCLPSPNSSFYFFNSYFEYEEVKDDTGIHVLVSVPGANKENLNIKIKSNVLHITVKKQESKTKPTFATFSNRTELRYNLTGDALKCYPTVKLENGILKLHWPKNSTFSLEDKDLVVT